MTTSEQLDDQPQTNAIYVYGIVPADVEVEESAQGVGDPPAPVDVIREGDIAALVSPVATDQPLGKPADLHAHAELLDGTAGVAPVLPLRFGAVMTDEESVAAELLRGHYDEFNQALAALEGHAEYIVKGRYDQDAFLRTVLSENEQAQALRDDIRGKSEELGRNSRMALGELIANAVETKRQADTQTAVAELEGVVQQVSIREPTHEWDAVNIALLAEVDREAEIVEVLDRLRESSHGLVDFRLRGPLAAYDFVVTAKPEG